MPSWNDGLYSSDSVLGDLTELDYAPETVEDPSFCGIAVGCGQVCRVHKMEPMKCVAFEGSNTGRKFYLCPVENHVNNCGFQSWIDGEWPETLQNALKRLWGMYHASNCGRVDEKLENAKFIQEIYDEKKLLEKKYASLLEEVRKFSDDTERGVQENNYKKIMSGAQDELQALKKEVLELRQIQRTQADMLQAKKQEWDAEREALKEEKRKVEYAVYEMLKGKEVTNERFNRIKAICDE